MECVNKEYSTLLNFIHVCFKRIQHTLPTVLIVRMISVKFHFPKCLNHSRPYASYVKTFSERSVTLREGNNFVYCNWKKIHRQFPKMQAVCIGFSICDGQTAALHPKEASVDTTLHSVSQSEPRVTSLSRMLCIYIYVTLRWLVQDKSASSTRASRGNTDIRFLMTLEPCKQNSQFEIKIYHNLFDRALDMVSS